MFRELYNGILKLADHPRAAWVLFLVAFIESSIFPIPPDILLVPMVLVRVERAFWYATICTAGSVFGGIAGYLIGYIFYHALGEGIVSFYGFEEHFGAFRQWYAEYDVYIVGVAGFSPIPYKIFTIASGILEADPAKFVLASIISRGARFFLISWLLWRGGRRLKGWIEYNLNPLTMAASIALIIGIVLLKFLGSV